MAGIHGRESEGSYSIVLSGGYEDDEDDGDEFTYSGSGGRDLSGNKRTAKQSYDQKLTHMNRYCVCVCVCVCLDIIVDIIVCSYVRFSNTLVKKRLEKHHHS